MVKSFVFKAEEPSLILTSAYGFKVLNILSIKPNRQMVKTTNSKILYELSCPALTRKMTSQINSLKQDFFEINLLEEAAKGMQNEITRFNNLLIYTEGIIWGLGFEIIMTIEWK